MVCGLSSIVAERGDGIDHKPSRVPDFIGEVASAHERIVGELHVAAGRGRVEASRFAGFVLTWSAIVAVLVMKSLFSGGNVSYDYRDVAFKVSVAFVVCQVLEKACKAFIEAEFLGGAKSINRVEAFLMHQFYLRKYSALKEENPRKGA